MFRHYDIANNYKIHKNITKEFYSNYDEFLMNKLFGKSYGYVIIKNIFHYHLKDNQKHFCLWIYPKQAKYWSKTRIKLTINSFIEKNNFKLITFFKNPIAQQSIKTIPHWHIIVKYTKF